MTQQESKQASKQAEKPDPQQVVAVFIVVCRQGLGRYAGFELGQRGQLQELLLAVFVVLLEVLTPFLLHDRCACCFACRQGLGRYAGFELGQRGQLQELFDELGNPGAKRSAGESK
jgi:methyl coenzyme M reductase subunit C